MPGTVAVTPRAHDAANQFMQIINSGLTETLQNLKTQGDVLADGQDWQGPLAQQFQEVWSSMTGDFTRMIGDLEDLIQRVEKILASITQAGGG
jgi:uncharacterized protein YukE